MNIAIDGPAGSGKSTLAKAIAKKLGLYYLDTGSMYRCVAFAAIKSNTDISDESQVKLLMDKTHFEVKYMDGHQQNIYEGENVMPYIRTPRISKAASDISAYPCVRHKLVSMQRDVAKNYDIVLDGRDIGTFVLPGADYKFFVTADLDERAKRRHLENNDNDNGNGQSLQNVLAEMKQRDFNDSNRKLAPLKQASDAVFIDTTNLSIDEAVTKIIGFFK